jgi:ATP-dependent RNA helicase DeaD
MVDAGPSLIPLALTGRGHPGPIQDPAPARTAAFGLPMLHMKFAESSPFAGAGAGPHAQELAVQVPAHANPRAWPLHDPEGNRPSTAAKNNEHADQQAPEEPADHRRHPRTSHGHAQPRLLPYDKVKVAVLDEVDRMLDIGFRDDIRKILGTMSPRSPDHLRLSDHLRRNRAGWPRQYMRDPQRLALAESKSLTSRK